MMNRCVSKELQVEPKPLLKWAGGKRQLLGNLLDSVPKEFNYYYEPFLGGGALFFKLSSMNKIKYAHLNDCNKVLMDSYKVVKEKPHELIEELKSPKYLTDEVTFYKIRAEEPTDLVKATARLFYLNRTAFNGLYRVNSKGHFNVPYGRYANPRILDEANILVASKALQRDELMNGDFEQATITAKEKDFVYFDPPYQPLSKTSSFTSYTKESFSQKDQERLAKNFKKLSNNGCFVMLSNSFNEWVVDLYKDYNVKTVQATRMINCKAEGRRKIAEVIITNY
jgi:DNA adenine methylase